MHPMTPQGTQVSPSSEQMQMSPSTIWELERQAADGSAVRTTRVFQETSRQQDLHQASLHI